MECSGGVIELTLRYNGAVAANVVIESGNVIYDNEINGLDGVVNPGEVFTIAGTRSDGKFENNDLDVFIDGVEQSKRIHVSCSRPIGPGAIFGDLEVVEAFSRDNPLPVCALPDCMDCKGGVIKLTLLYTGAVAANVVIESGNVIYNNEINGLDGVVNPGEVFTIAGTRSDGKFENNDLDVFIDGVEQSKRIHVSCSQPIGPGAIFGDLEVVEALSKDNPRPVCALPDCLECGGGVIELTLRYNGADGRFLRIESGNVVYDIGLLNSGDVFTIQGTRSDGKFENNDLDVFIDGVRQSERIHVSCSQPIGPGALFGDLEVVEAISRDNGTVCPLPGCMECDGGVIELTLRYNGADGRFLRIESGNAVYDIGLLNSGDVFTIQGTRSDGKFENNDLDVFIDGVRQSERIHVSCSQPIGPGALFGDLEVVEAISRDNPRPVCPLPDCMECKGGVIELTLRYNGADGRILRIESGNAVYDIGLLNSGDVFTIQGTRSDGKFENNDLDVFIDGVRQSERIHVSCSQPIGPGALFGDLEVVEAISRDNPRPVCPLPDCMECKGGVIELTLRYDGATAAQIVIESGNVVYDSEINGPDGVVAPGEIFTIQGTRSDGKFENNDLDVFIDGVPQSERIHVSCSRPIGPGLSFGRLFVVEVFSKDNPQPVCAFCEGDLAPPEISYLVEAGNIVRITITDDLALDLVDLQLRAFQIDRNAVDLIGPEIFPGDVRFPVILENTFLAGSPQAVIRVQIDPSVNTTFMVVATDICDRTPCQADPNPPKFLNVRAGDADNDGVIDASGQVSDAAGIVSLDFFILQNAFVEFSDFFPGATLVNFRVERVNPASGANFGALAADACNAFAFDYEFQ